MIILPKEYNHVYNHNLNGKISVVAKFSVCFRELSAISLCFFHLMQSLYRKVKEKGLQSAYNNPEDRTIKEFVHKLAALVFVPISDVEDAFATLQPRAPQELDEYVEYFDATYVNGVPARGRRRALASRYAIHLWNQYDATIDVKLKRTTCRRDGTTDFIC